AAEAEGFGGLADVAAVAGQGFADQESLDFLQAHVFQLLRRFARGAQAEVAVAHQLTLGEQYGALDGMIEFAHVAGPGVVEHGLERGGLKAGELLAVAAGVMECIASSGMSVRRSRMGGMWIATVLRRKSRSSRKRPAAAAAWRLALVAEMTRTSTRY